MIAFIRKLRKDRRGNVLAMTAAFLPMVVGAAGLATDTIQWTLWRRQLQRAADSAAFAGVYDRAANSGGTANVSNAVCRDLAVNLHTWMGLLGTTPCAGSVGSYAELNTDPSANAFITNRVMVRLQVQKALPFSSMFMSVAPIIQASATAGSVRTGGSPCMLALSSTGTAIDNSGNTTVTAPSCIFYSNSASSNSAAAGGSSSVTARAIAGVGGIANSNNWHVNSYLPYSPSLPDPFAPPSTTAVTPDPNDMRCAQQAVTTTTTTTVVDTPAWTETVTGKNGKTTTINHPAVTHDVTTTNTTYTGSAQSLEDGVDITTLKDANGNQANCFTALNVGSNRTLSIPSSYTGPIYINGGNVDLKGAFSCGACTIVLTNKNPTSTTIGTFSSNAQATNNITAPTSGTFKGIAIYQDRRAPGGNVDKINGGASNIINGVVYFPRDTLWLNGTGNTVSLCSMFVANTLKFNGNGSLGISSAEDTACGGILPQVAATTVVRLIS